MNEYLNVNAGWILHDWTSCTFFFQVTQVGSAPAEKSATVKPHPPHVQKDEGSKQNVPPQSSQSEWSTDDEHLLRVSIILVSLKLYYNIFSVLVQF